jgi:threonyl-tRNA synthetase
MSFIKEEYWKRGYDEVITPNVFNLDLWHQSGHAMHYRDGMFLFDVEGKEWGMKPMNCPGHCLIFGSSTRSWRELPMRCVLGSEGGGKKRREEGFDDDI